MIRKMTLRLIGAILLAGGATLLLGIVPTTAAQEVRATQTLITADQRLLDTATTDLLRQPNVQAAAAAVFSRWQALPQAMVPDTTEKMRGAVDELVFFAVKLATQQVLYPETIGWFNSPPYASGIPGTRFGIDDPNRIYRVVAVDPSRSYIIEGKRSLVPSNDDYTFEATDDFRTLESLDGRNIDLSADGTFSITLDAQPSAGRRNHLALADGTNNVVIRDTLSNWKTQLPNRLTFRQTGGTTPSSVSLAQAQQRAVSLIEKSDRLVSGMLSANWAQPENTFVAKVRTLDQGLPGYIFASARFALKQDEALIVTIDPHGAHYTGIVATDPWARSAPYWTGFASLSGDQSRPNTDGSLTYIVAARDPGYANWVDTNGVGHGIVGIRIENIPQPNTVDANKVVRSARVVRLAELDSAIAPGMEKVSPKKRAQQLDEHRASFIRRIEQ